MANEKRLIDANKAQAVLANMAEHLMEAGNPEMAGAVGYAAEVISKQPTVDAVEVPCKVGDYVYYIKGGYYKDPQYCEVSRPCKIVEVSIKLKRDSGRVMYGFITDNGTRYSFNGIGKTVFLTREKAEAALAKMQRKDDT